MISSSISPFLKAKSTTKRYDEDPGCQPDTGMPGDPGENFLTTL
jgi:hypothetical protein